MDLAPIVDQGLVIAFAALCLASAYSDFRTMKIPNRYSIAIALLYPAHVVASGGEVEWLRAVAIAAGFLVVGIFIFSRGWLGAGDVKLMSATVLWAGQEQLPYFLFVMGMTAGAMTIFLMLRQRLRPTPSPVQLSSNDALGNDAKQQMPFGLAISTGALYVAFTLLV